MITLALILMLQLPAQVKPPISQLGGHDPGEANTEPGIYGNQLTGKVIGDQLGLLSVEVLLKDQGGFIIRKTQTFSNGVFHFDAVELGCYRIQVADPRFKLANYWLNLQDQEDVDREVIVALEPSGGNFWVGQSAGRIWPCGGVPDPDGLGACRE